MNRVPTADFRELINEFNSRVVSLWNEGRLEEFCRGYAEDAVYVTASGRFSGRETILEQYRTEYADRSKMGKISVEICNIRFGLCEGCDTVNMATTVIHWAVKTGDETISGHSMVTFELTESGLVITQDTSA